MDPKDHKIIMYTAQAQVVIDTIRNEGVAYSKARYVESKYQESAASFLVAYRWLAKHMPEYVVKPDLAEFPYWAFHDRYHVEASDANVLKLAVPMDEVLGFDMYDWNRILQLQYLGQTPQEEARFRRELEAYGIRHASDVMLSHFYPDLSRRIEASWQRLFRHAADIQAGKLSEVQALQFALWRIKQDWIV